MKTLLQIDSSGKGSQSVTKALTAEYVAQWKAANSGGRVISRDLNQSNLQFLSPELIGAFYTPEEALAPEQKQLLKQSDELIEEIFEADEYVFGVPMYNFSVPAIFKAYIDLIVRVNKTFTYAGGVPKGLLQNKRIVLVTASGGDYSAPPMNALDFVEPYVRGLFGFAGVTDIQVVKVFGHDPETIERTTNAAKAALQARLAASVR